MSRPRSFDSQVVVDAAMQAFWSGGVASTSIDDLLQATGLSRSSLYNSFGNRDALMQAAVERYAQQQSASIQRLFKGRSLEQALTALLLEAATSNYEGRGCLLVNAVGELHETGSEGMNSVRQALAHIASTLEESIRLAAPQRQDIPQLCVAILAAIAGLRTMQRAGLPLALRQHATQLLVKGLIGN